jgi:very-short-patch-repair endonuclease
MQTEQYKKQQIRGLKYSRGMKRRPTKSEALLASALERHGIAFKQQAFFFTEHTLFIPDFRIPCKHYKLVVEVDGKNHNSRKHYDDERTRWLEKNRNCRVIRFTNEAVIADVESVITEIKTHHPKAKAEIDADKRRNPSKRDRQKKRQKKMWHDAIMEVGEVLAQIFKTELSWIDR